MSLKVTAVKFFQHTCLLDLFRAEGNFACYTYWLTEAERFLMPLYQFYCKKCEKVFEVFLRISEAYQRSVCPYCHGDETERSSETEGKENRDTLTPGVCGVKKDS